MIGALRGTVIESRDGVLTVDVGGVGYVVAVTSSVLSAGVAGEVRLVVQTEVRENDITLYGFASVAEREVYLLLRKVKGIGGKTALGIVSSLGAERLLACIGQQDLNLLCSVPGVGKKTAERILVELREQVAELLPVNTISRAELGSLRNRIEIDRTQVWSGFESYHNPALRSCATDAVLALEKLGFSSERARAAILITLEAAGSDPQFPDAGELLRAALANV